MIMKLLQRKILILVLMGVLLLSFTPQLLACGCGCNIFSVGNRWMMVSTTGYRISLQYSYMDQTQNWNSTSHVSSDLNSDKELRTGYYTFGFQYMVTRDWGVMAEVPMWNRFFSTLDDNNNPASVQHLSSGDIRLIGVYTGLSEDMSTAISFGLKLPTGSFNQTLFDRDTQIGTGTTDLLLGAYQVGQEHLWGWYVQGMFQDALNTRDEYRPGYSLDLSIGLHYDNLLRTIPIIPMIQILGSIRGHDSGARSHPVDTGYQRLLIAPGFEITITRQFQLFADVRIPIVTNVSGYQLVAPYLTNLSASMSF